MQLGSVKPMVGVMIPTRGRVALLRECLDSLNNTVRFPENAEILLKVDEDDEPTIEALRRYHRNSDIDLRYVVTPRYSGYGSLHHFYNMLAGISRASHVMVFNDDCEMLTEEWDDYYEQYRDTGFVIGSRTLVSADSPAGREHGGEFAIFDTGPDGYNGHPAINRELIQHLGTISWHPMVDDWWQETTKKLPYLSRWVDVDVLFKRPDGLHTNAEADATFIEGRRHINWSHHGSFGLANYKSRIQMFFDSRLHMISSPPEAA